MLISGKAIAEELLESYERRAKQAKRKAKLVVLLPPDNPASVSYVRMKELACARVGILSSTLPISLEVTEKELLKQIQALNKDPQVDGILLQLPLPSQIDEKKMLLAIDPAKDVDGFHPVNMGKLLLGLEGGFVPCTPLGVQVLLQKSGIDTAGKHVVIVGRSNIVGKPLAALLMQKKKGANATVTLAHSQTPHLKNLTNEADILIAALGKPHFIKKEMVKKGAVVIDVGLTRVGKKLQGDVDFEDVKEKCMAITPVPGGVGPMTVAMLMHNTLQSLEQRC